MNTTSHLRNTNAHAKTTIAQAQDSGCPAPGSNCRWIEVLLRPVLAWSIAAVVMVVCSPELDRAKAAPLEAVSLDDQIHRSAPVNVQGKTVVTISNIV